MPEIEWSEPDSMDDALARQRILIAQIEDIETQLGDPRRKQSLTKEEWQSWRQSAKWARVTRLQEKRLLKAWIYEHRSCPAPV